jgi:hypothetical protein
MDVAEDENLGCQLVSVKLFESRKITSKSDLFSGANDGLDTSRRNRARASKRRGIRASSMPRIMRAQQVI